MNLHRGSADGELLAAFTVPEILPGAYQDLTYRWQSPPAELGGVATVWAVIDEADVISEFDEDNNARSALVPVSTRSSPA